MYVVASTWEIVKGKRAEAEALGIKMRSLMRAQSGIESMLHFPTGEDEIMVVVSYSDEAAYNRIINDPNGPFEKALKEVDLESTMRWKQSWRGTAVPE
jgi:heme-degrading monooxygenase HmoA